MAQERLASYAVRGLMRERVRAIVQKSN